MMSKDVKYQCPGEIFSWTAFANKSNYVRRLVGTGIAFALFGVSGLILCLTLFPLLTLLSRDHSQRLDRVRFVIRYSFKAYLKIIEFLGVLKVETHGLDKLQNLKGALIICNHPSLLDVVVIMAHLKNIQCVVKNELWRNPFLGGVVRAAGYIRNDLNPEQFYKDCKEQLLRGENIIIFPEGTRSIPGKPIKLQRSLGNLAIAAEANIQALTMECTPITLVKGEKWYKIPLERPVFHLKRGPLFYVAKDKNKSPRSLRVRALMRDIQQYYNGYLGYE